MNLTDYGIAVGNPADLVVLDSNGSRQWRSPRSRSRLLGIKRGRRSFTRAAPLLHVPH